jgi:hypothetical protein
MELPHNSMAPKIRILLTSIVPPRNDCGVRIVMYRHLVEHNPFELHIASNADFAEDFWYTHACGCPILFIELQSQI